jgi:hypothetical protein
MYCVWGHTYSMMRTQMYSYCYVCVRIHTHMSSYCYMCVRIHTHMSSYCYMCVPIHAETRACRLYEDTHIAV